MPPDPSERGGSRHSAGLLLRVLRPDGRSDELYLAHGLTIGRTLANAVVLADDEAVDRTHARVEIDDDGAARLRCVEPDGAVGVGGAAVRELPLAEGVRFRIGRAEFECISGRRGADPPEDVAGTACPFCSATDVTIEREDVPQCPACKGLILPVRPDPEGPRPILLPAVYGAYRAERYVARGGMGLVLRGAREVDAGPVAIKVLMAGLLADRHDAGRYELEVAMLARVRHPNVVQLIDHGTSGRCHYLVLEWVEGPSLREVIAGSRRAGRLPSFAEAFHLFAQVGKGLAAIHAVGMVHRDVKPSNILIGPDEVAKVADLGIARRIDAAQTSCTTTGNAPGTFEYMAPEQINTPDTVDGRADLYALGVTFHEVLTGVRPVGAWQPASKSNPSVPREFDDVIRRLLAPLPADRFEDIHEVLGICSHLSKKPLPEENAESHARSWWRVSLPGGTNTCRGDDAEDESFLGILCSSVANEAFLEILGEGGIGLFSGGVTGLLIGMPIIPCALIGLIYGVCLCIHKMVPATFLGALVGGSFAFLVSYGLGWRADAPLMWGLVGGALVTAAQVAHWLLTADSRAYFFLAEHCAEGGKQAMAIICYTKAIRLGLASNTDGCISFAYQNRGNLYRLRGRYNRAIADCTEAIRHTPQSDLAYCLRGLAHRDSGDLERAIADYTEGIRINPRGLGYRVRGQVYSDQADFDRAIADYDEFIRIHPQDPIARADRGLAYQAKGNLDESIADFEAALRLDPTEPQEYKYRLRAAQDAKVRHGG